MFEKAEIVKEKINRATARQQPFLFGVDFELNDAFFIENPFNQTDILFCIRGSSNTLDNYKANNDTNKSSLLKSYPESYSNYLSRFKIVENGIKYGNSFLLNLTSRTSIETEMNLKEIFLSSKALYKLYIPNSFVCFSPERFIKIENGTISSNPMKGTISADIPNAEKIIIENLKEQAEHYTIVDLIRNDLNQIATDVEVTKFRYIDKIETNNGNILQVSSEIRGKLPTDYERNLGDLIFKLLPAGSISGAPKKASIDIIKSAEKIPRGFYSGIFGLFDGKNLDSAVLIRYIEKREGSLFFRSGGGITINSDPASEYNEMIQKIYLPI